jgi:ribosome-associated toxin RatA of RatAB toxin-antitoxin module
MSSIVENTINQDETCGAPAPLSFSIEHQLYQAMADVCRSMFDKLEYNSVFGKSERFHQIFTTSGLDKVKLAVKDVMEKNNVPHTETDIDWYAMPFRGLSALRTQEVDNANFKDDVRTSVENGTFTCVTPAEMKANVQEMVREYYSQEDVTRVYTMKDNETPGKKVNVTEDELDLQEVKTTDLFWNKMRDVWEAERDDTLTDDVDLNVKRNGHIFGSLYHDVMIRFSGNEVCKLMAEDFEKIAQQTMEKEENEIKTHAPGDADGN